MRRVLFLLPLLVSCAGDRGRPGPVEPVPELEARLLAPAPGATVSTGEDITVAVEGRDLNLLHLEGVGFVARRQAPGLPLVDSAAVRFAARADTIHAFTFQVPNTFPTNAQVDVYGIAFGPVGVARLSAPVHLVVVQCVDGVCR